MLTVYVIIALLCIWLFQKLRIILHYEKIYRDLPGEEDMHWLWGNMHTYPGLNEDGLMYDFNKSKRFKYFNVIWISRFCPMLQVYHPETMAEIIKATSVKPRNLGLLSTSYDMGVPWIGNGLILGNGERWARNRRLLTPAFHFDILKKYVRVYNSCVGTFQGKLLEMYEEGKSIDIQPLVTKYTLDVILQCAFSYISNCQTAKNEYSEGLEELAESWAKRALNALLFADFVYKLTPRGRKYYHLCDIAHKQAEDTMRKRQQEIADNYDKLDTPKVRDFLDTLLLAKDEDGNGLSWEEIREECDTFMFAGHDTTTSGITWTLVSLAQHPQYQERVYNEVMSVLGDKSELEWEDISKLNFTGQCIKEALRDAAPVPIIERVTTEDILLHGYHIPARTRVSLNIWMLQHNPHVWEEPHKYNPDRFHPDKAVKMHPLQFMPFSAGSRNCIGQNFAMNEMKITIAEIVRKFSLHTDPNWSYRRSICITMRADKGAYIRAIPRNRLVSPQV